VSSRHHGVHGILKIHCTTSDRVVPLVVIVCRLFVGCMIRNLATMISLAAQIKTPARPGPSIPFNVEPYFKYPQDNWHRDTRFVRVVLFEVFFPQPFISISHLHLYKLSFSSIQPHTRMWPQTTSPDRDRRSTLDTVAIRTPYSFYLHAAVLERPIEKTRIKGIMTPDRGSTGEEATVGWRSRMHNTAASPGKNSITLSARANNARGSYRTDVHPWGW